MKIAFTVVAEYIRFCAEIRPAINPHQITVYPNLLWLVLDLPCREVAMCILSGRPSGKAYGNYRISNVCAAAA